MNLLKFLPLVIFLIVSIFLYNKLKFQKKLEPLSSALIQKKIPPLKVKNLDISAISSSIFQIILAVLPF